eukprot:g35593.t1
MFLSRAARNYGGTFQSVEPEACLWPVDPCLSPNALTGNCVCPDGYIAFEARTVDYACGYIVASTIWECVLRAALTTWQAQDNYAGTFSGVNCGPDHCAECIHPNPFISSSSSSSSSSPPTHCRCPEQSHPVPSYLNLSKYVYVVTALGNGSTVTTTTCASDVTVTGSWGGSYVERLGSTECIQGNSYHSSLGCACPIGFLSSISYRSVQTPFARACGPADSGQPDQCDGDRGVLNAPISFRASRAGLYYLGARALEVKFFDGDPGYDILLIYEDTTLIATIDRPSVLSPFYLTSFATGFRVVWVSDIIMEGAGWEICAHAQYPFTTSTYATTTCVGPALPVDGGNYQNVPADGGNDQNVPGGPAASGNASGDLSDNGPIVRKVSGCPHQSEDGVGTANCSTRGGDVITITGERLYQPPPQCATGDVNGGVGADVNLDVHCESDTASSTFSPAAPYNPVVTVAGAACLLLSASPSVLTCVLPPSCGRPTLSVRTSGLSNSNSFTNNLEQQHNHNVHFLIEYARPSITRISSDGCRSVSDLQVVDCKRNGVSLTLQGKNFGLEGAQVLIGPNDIISTITCWAPPGHSHVPSYVFLLQKQGHLSAETVLFSYLPCPAGSQLQASSLRCTECAAGSFSGLPGSACTPCAPGFASGPNSSECLFCPAGRHSIEQGTVWPCALCPPGSFSGRPGSTQCVPCEPGTAQPDLGQTRCLACPPSSFTSEHASTKCKPCPPGTYSAVPGSRLCLPCAAGTFVMVSHNSPPQDNSAVGGGGGGGSNCEVCRPGWVLTLPGVRRWLFHAAGQQKCHFCPPCPAGTFAPSSGMTHCLLCSIGKYAWGTGPSSCGACPVGTMADENGTSRCQACPAMRYQDKEGAATCLPCPPGQVAHPKHHLCQECPAGTVANLTCQACPVGKVADKSVGSYSENTNRQEKDETCRGCPRGGLCNQDGLSTQSILVAPGYWRHSHQSPDFYPCPPHFCQGGNSTGNCGPHRTGPLCALCVAAHVRTAHNTCRACPARRFSLLFAIGLIALLAGAAVALYYLIFLAERRCAADLAPLLCLTYTPPPEAVLFYSGLNSSSGRREAISDMSPSRAEQPGRRDNNIGNNMGPAELAADAKENRDRRLAGGSQQQLPSAAAQAEEQGDDSTVLASGLALASATRASISAVSFGADLEPRASTSTVASVSSSEPLPPPGAWTDFRTSLSEQDTCRSSASCEIMPGEEKRDSVSSVGPASVSGVAATGFLPQEKGSTCLRPIKKEKKFLGKESARAINFDQAQQERVLQNMEEGVKRALCRQPALHQLDRCTIWHARGRQGLVSSFKILIGFLQLISSLVTSSAPLPLPLFPARAAGALQVANLDLIPWFALRCLTGLSYYQEVLVSALLPVLLMAVLLCYTAWSVRRERTDYSDEGHRSRLVKLLIFTGFLTYPALCSKILAFFYCTQINGDWYLVADMRLSCFDSLWYFWLPVLVVLVLTYPIGLPLFLFLRLRHFHRKDLLSARHIRAAYGSLYESYLRVAWWWDLLEMFHKLLLTSLLLLLSPNLRMLSSLLVCGGFLILLLIFAPFLRRGDDRLQLLAQVLVFSLVFMAFTASQTGGYTPAMDIALSVIVLILSIGLLVHFAILNWPGRGIVAVRPNLSSRILNKRKFTLDAQKAKGGVLSDESVDDT